MKFRVVQGLIGNEYGFDENLYTLANLEQVVEA
jgi:hypothetical protein